MNLPVTMRVRPHEMPDGWAATLWPAFLLRCLRQGGIALDESKLPKNFASALLTAHHVQAALVPPWEVTWEIDGTLVVRGQAAETSPLASNSKEKT